MRRRYDILRRSGIIKLGRNGFSDAMKNDLGTIRYGGFEPAELLP